MSVLRRLRHRVAGPPANAHGRVKGGEYWSWWECAHGHRSLGTPTVPPGSCYENVPTTNATTGSTPHGTSARARDAYRTTLALEDGDLSHVEAYR